jgi:GR25 family glycosyltransferase involved in LPS biosynthesis
MAMIKQAKHLRQTMHDRYRQSDHGHKYDAIGVDFINLDRSTDRRRFMNQQFTDLDIPFHRVRATDGRTLDTQRFVNKYPWSHTMSPARLATTLSHLRAVKQAYDDGQQFAMICEDDVSFMFVPLWETTLREKLMELPKDWEIFRLTTLYPQWSDSPTAFYKDTKTPGAIAYIVNRKFMRKVAESCFPNEIPHLEPGYNDVQPKHSGNVLLADKFLWKLSEGTYVSGRPLVFPFNDYGGFDSTIMSHFTITMVFQALYIMNHWAKLLPPEEEKIATGKQSEEIQASGHSTHEVHG